MSMATVENLPSATQERPIGFGRLKRKEDARFIRGKGNYLDDIRLPGMVHGAVLRSPYAHARIVSIDTSRALAHPNVAAVITAKDLETLGLAWMPTISYDTQAVLAGDKVRFQGQEVAFVIATDEYSARDALELIDVEYDPLPAVVNARRALDPDAPLIRDDKDDQRDNLASPTWEAGDEDATDRVFAEADTVVTRDIIYPRCHPAPLETCGMIADFNPETGQLDIYNGNQAPHAHRTVYAHVAGLAEHKIRIMCNDIGGGFGNKVPVYPGYVCAIAGSIVAGVPVKWIEDRSENLMSTGFARDYVMKAEMCAKDGRITGLRVDVIADHGAFDSTAQPTKFPAGFFHIVCGSYDLRASHVKVKAVYTNKAPGGVAYRCSFRITEAVYLVERMVKALAMEMGVDEVELRMRSFIGSDQFPYETTTGWTYDSGNYAETMKVALDMAGYDDLRREQAEKRARGELMGIGVSFFTEGVGAGPRKHMDILGLAMNDGADLRVHPSGKAVVSLSAQTQGQGHETTFAQIVAEELGIPPEDVEVRHGDTDTCVWRRGRVFVAQGARQGAPHRGDDARDPARGPRLGEGPLVRQGRPGAGRAHRGHRRPRVQRRADARGHGGRPGRAGHLRPAEPHLPVRRVHRGGRRRPRDGARDGAAVHRGRRLRRADQPDDRRRPDPRRAGRGDRHRAHGGHHVRRGGQLLERVVHGLPDPDGARVPRLRAGRDGHALPAPPAGREGRGRVAERRLAAGDRQRDHRRAARDARRRPHRHALHPGARVGGDAGPARAAAVMRARRRTRDAA
jgi:CO/xanthine dehydrogenase Mo-binding subunit